MAQTTQIKVDVEDGRIVVTLPGTTFQATYFKQPEEPQIRQHEAMTGDSGADISRKEFEVLAWKAAEDKARELGWIE